MWSAAVDLLAVAIGPHVHGDPLILEISTVRPMSRTSTSPHAKR
jgi:hypothetical protein